MENSSIFEIITEADFANTTHFDLSLQIGVLSVSILLSLFMRTHWNRLIETKIGVANDRFSLRNIALRGSKRLSFSLSLSILIILAYGILEVFGRSTGVLYLSAPFVIVLATIRILVYLLQIAAGPGVANRTMEFVVSLTLWFTFALYLVDWLPRADDFLNDIALTFGNVHISLLNIIHFLLISALLILFALALSRFVEIQLSKKNALDSGVQLGLIKIIRYGLLCFAVLLALSTSGFNLSNLALIGGALSVGIGFGLQKITSNLISGFIMLFDRSVRPGDVISIGGSYGWVNKMCSRYLVLRDRDGIDTLIPNEEVITSQVINWSYGDRHIRLKLPIQISYDDDPELAMQLMLDASKISERIIKKPAPAARIMGFGDNGIDLELRVWIDDPEQGINNVRSDINLAIWKAFKEHAITIPFPQRVVQIKP